MGIEVNQDMLWEVLPLFKANIKALRLMIPLFAAAGECAGAHLLPLGPPEPPQYSSIYL